MLTFRDTYRGRNVSGGLIGALFLSLVLPACVQQAPAEAPGSTGGPAATETVEAAGTKAASASHALTNITYPTPLGQAPALAKTGDAAAPAGKPPNIVIIWGDDIGQNNISAYSKGQMGYQTPSIDSVAREGLIFTDYYAEQSCTAGRAAFITG